MANPNPVRLGTLWERAIRWIKRGSQTGWLIALVLAAVGAFVGWHFAPIAAGADSGGYLGSARLLAAGHTHGELRQLPEWPLANAGPFTYVPLGFLDLQRTGRLTPSYPVGLPLQYAVAGKLFGWTWGPTLVGIFSAVVAVLCCYLALREFEVVPWLATGCAALLALSPMFLFVSFVPLSDTVATAWCALAFVAALRARRHAGYPALAGFAVSVAVLVRPTNVLMIPVVALVIGNWRGWLMAAAAALPVVGFDLWYNHAMYGSAFATGYGSVDELFQGKFVVPALHNYVTTLPRVLPLGIVALVLLPFLPWRARARDLLALVLWFAVFAVFYSAYQYTGEYWWYLRFILPAFPAAIVLAGIGLQHVVTALRERGRARAAFVLLTAVFASSVVLTVATARRYHVLNFPVEQRPHRIVPQWARDHLPPNAAVFCFHLSAGFYFYTDFVILRSDQFNPEELSRFREAVRKTHRPVYAAIFRFQRDEVFRDNIPGPWHKVADVADAEIWQLDTGA